MSKEGSLIPHDPPKLPLIKRSEYKPYTNIYASYDLGNGFTVP